MEAKPLIVGIAGGSGAGKTTFLHALQKELGKGNMTVFSLDNYYLPADKQKVDENGETNFDLPTAIDRARYFQDLCALEAGRNVEVVEYDFNNEDADPKVLRIPSAPVIVTEGLFVFEYEEVFAAMDLRILLDVDADIRLQRRIQRDGVERGYDEADVRYRWKHHVLPAEATCLEPFRDRCDLVVDNNDNFEFGLAQTVARIRILQDA